MTADPRLQTLLAALGAHIGLNDLALNDDNVCRLILDDTTVIDIEHQPGTDNVQAFSVVGPSPGNNVQLCHQLLAANLFGQGTGGAVLGLDEQRNEILLTQGFDLSTVTPEKFISTLEVLIDQVEAWSDELMNAETGDDEEDEDGEDAAGTAPVDSPASG